MTFLRLLLNLKAEEMAVKRFLLLSAVAASVFCADDELAKALEETTGIATKTRINADYVPGTVSIVKGEELKALGILNLNQPNALDMIVGMDSSVNALRGSGAVFGGQGNKIKWLLNGRSLSSQLWSGFIWGRGIISFPILVDQIDRIEIIRGPDSAIYGDNAIFGVINIITKRSVNDVATSVSYQGEGKNGKSATANLAYAKNDLELSASMSVHDTDGYEYRINDGGNFANAMTGGHTPGYGPGNLANNSSGYNVLLDAKYDSFSAWLNRLETESAQGAFGNWYPSDMLPQDNDKKVRKESFTQFGIQKEFAVGEGTLTPKVGMDIFESTLNDFLRVGSMYMNNAVGVDGTRNYRYKEERKHIALDGERKIGDHHLVGGILAQTTKNTKDAKYENFSYVGPWIPLPPLNIWRIVPSQYVGAVAAAPNTYRGQSAFYLQDAWDIDDKTTVTVGARYDKFDGDTKSNGWSPRVAVVYRADENNILKAQYARAFRPPSFAETSGVSAGIKSETVDTLELGHIYKSSRTTFKTTIFESRIYDMITFNDITYDTENMPGKGVIRGLEMEAKYEGDKFRIALNQAFYKTDSEARVYRSANNANDFRFEGGSFVLSPSMMTNIMLTLNQNESYPTTLWYHYVGSKQRKSIYTTTDAYYIGSSNGDTPAQDYLNFTQQFKGIAKNLDLAMGIQNVFGKTLKTLYMPLNQPNNQDIPYMRQSFWANLHYKF